MYICIHIHLIFSPLSLRLFGHVQDVYVLCMCGVGDHVCNYAIVSLFSLCIPLFSHFFKILLLSNNLSKLCFSTHIHIHIPTVHNTAPYTITLHAYTHAHSIHIHMHMNISIHFHVCVCVCVSEICRFVCVGVCVCIYMCV